MHNLLSCMSTSTTVTFWYILKTISHSSFLCHIFQHPYPVLTYLSIGWSFQEILLKSNLFAGINDSSYPSPEIAYAIRARSKCEDSILFCLVYVVGIWNSYWDIRSLNPIMITSFFSLLLMTINDSRIIKSVMVSNPVYCRLYPLQNINSLHPCIFIAQVYWHNCILAELIAFH